MGALCIHANEQTTKDAPPEHQVLLGRCGVGDAGILEVMCWRVLMQLC